MGISATSMVQPLSAPMPEMMAQAAMSTPPAEPPNMLLSASANGAEDSSSRACGTVPMTATVLSMYRAAQARTPMMLALPMLRAGSLIFSAAMETLSTPE
ncbi:hypothetical protein GCM10020219_025460 [Nonomuraea dietziae]